MSVSLEPLRMEDLPTDRLEAFLEPTEFILSEAPEVRAFAEAAIDGATDAVEQGVRLFYAVRDAIRYDPYHFVMERDIFKSPTTLRDQRSFCIPKAVLLAAAARAVGIPSALGFSDVRNHLTTKRLLELMGSDLFIWHGYTALFLDGAWVKATPAFNLDLCKKFGVKPLDFDGRHDAMLHPFDSQERRHMEYVADHGLFAELPYERIRQALIDTYPDLVHHGMNARPVGGNFESEDRL